MIKRQMNNNNALQWKWTHKKASSWVFTYFFIVLYIMYTHNFFFLLAYLYCCTHQSQIYLDNADLSYQHQCEKLLIENCPKKIIHNFLCTTTTRKKFLMYVLRDVCVYNRQAKTQATLWNLFYFLCSTINNMRTWKAEENVCCSEATTGKIRQARMCVQYV